MYILIINNAGSLPKGTGKMYGTSLLIFCF